MALNRKLFLNEDELTTELRYEIPTPMIRRSMVIGHIQLVTHELINPRGVFHREDGPAVYSLGKPDELFEYWYGGLLHREDGPAYYHDGNSNLSEAIEFWLHGEQYSLDRFLKTVDMTDEDKTLLKLKWG